MSDLAGVTYAIFGDIIQYAASATVALLLLVMLVIFIAQALMGRIE